MSTSPPLTPPETSAAEGLPSIEVAWPPRELLAMLDARARKGKLPGFRTRTDGPLFSTAAFATPFDHELLASAITAGNATRLTFELRMLRKLPTIAVVVLILTIWPGVWITQSMLATYFSWYQLDIWWTCAWYMPLTVGPLPWVWRKWVRGSRSQAREHAIEIIGDLRTWCEATPPLAPTTAASS